MQYTHLTVSCMRCVSFVRRAAPQAAGHDAAVPTVVVQGGSRQQRLHPVLELVVGGTSSSTFRPVVCDGLKQGITKG
jgi:hypothetical protein